MQITDIPLYWDVDDPEIKTPGVYVRRGAVVLLIPTNLSNFVVARSIRSARALLAHLRGCPGTFQVELGWTEKEIRNFTAAVLWSLHGTLPSSALVRKRRPSVAYGAYPPPHFVPKE